MYKFFSDRPIYFSGQNILSSYNIDISKRQGIANQILRGNDYKITIKLLKNENISYIYLDDYKKNSD
ncbi:MAG: hypothetical protein A2857_03415 [Candidatus Levybacteria bacterium RIFCSPHIGHO2_01_FULL_36_15]|nr:MAG: hypothetical protein A2857_03415 [Candidatus Levybacteria bacterium RIFCSPHIGHO2_01_FULL_36_15]